ncbi:MAG: LTA synthase family protein, partial [Oscillibacter sp.]
MKKLQSIPKRQLSWPLFFLAAVLLSGAITLLVLWCQPNSLRAVLAIFLAQPLLIVLNALPVGLLVLAFGCLFRNVFYSAAAVNLALCTLSIANRIKLEVRDEPVFPRDFGLLKEVGSAVQTYDIRFPVGIIAVVVGVSLLLALCGFFIGSKPFPLRVLRGWSGRIGGFLASGAVLTALIFTVYASNDLYNSFAKSNAYYIPSVFNELGFPYCFSHQFTTYPVDKPAGFNRSQAEAWEAEPVVSEGKPVHVILVMNEAFSDLTDEPMFTYPPEEDPLSNLHALRESPHALFGHVAVPGFAGGTANTEFDVLTGIQTNALSETTTSSFRVVNRDLDSLFRVFGGEGYHNSFFHPGDAWFYNRENVYNHLGAEEILFAADMPDLTQKGRWVTDDSMADVIEGKFEETVAADELLFNYTTTIQNHMSYTADKYGPSYLFPPVRTAQTLSAEAKTLLSVYAEGVRDADAMLGRLTDYFSATEEPVVLAFWGDHLPALGENQLAYNELGISLTPDADGTDSCLKSFETPYLIWANDAAAAVLDWDAAVKALDLPADGRISASFLGAAILELTGRETPWFAFLNGLRRELPVVQKQTYLPFDGA